MAIFRYKRLQCSHKSLSDEPRSSSSFPHRNEHERQKNTLTQFSLYGKILISIFDTLKLIFMFLFSSARCILCCSFFFCSFRADFIIFPLVLLFSPPKLLFREILFIFPSISFYHTTRLKLVQHPSPRFEIILLRI